MMEDSVKRQSFYFQPENQAQTKHNEQLRYHVRKINAPEFRLSRRFRLPFFPLTPVTCQISYASL